jgi:hypothetical protein
MFEQEMPEVEKHRSLGYKYQIPLLQNQTALISFFSLFIYSYVHTLFGQFLPLASPTPSLSPHPLASRQKLFCPFSNFVEEKTKAIIRKTKCFC